MAELAFPNESRDYRNARRQLLKAEVDLRAQVERVAAMRRALPPVHDAGIKPAARPKTTEKKELEVPADLTAALKKNKKALATFDGFNYTNKKEYVDWITEAKTDETRKKRLQSAVEWMSEGKSRHWKYQDKVGGHVGAALRGRPSIEAEIDW